MPYDDNYLISAANSYAVLGCAKAKLQEFGKLSGQHNSAKRQRYLRGQKTSEMMSFCHGFRVLVLRLIILYRI